jgi:hypothetical protein
MTRYIWIYGCIAGVILGAGVLLAMAANGHGGTSGMIAGYVSMIVALSLVFVGTKRYRDRELGGVIRFATALGIGAGIAGVASLFYVLGWEIYMYATNYTFMDDYAQSMIEAERAKGSAAATIAKLSAEMAAFSKQYANPLFRMMMTFAEIAPVAIIVPLVSAGLLRNPKLFPAKAG